MVETNIVKEHARIMFRNFTGAAGDFNPAGRRNFCVCFTQEEGERYEDEGWNIKWLEPKDEDDERQPYLQVAVSFGRIPPKIVLITSRGKTLLDESSVNILDWAEIENVDVIIRPYNWNFNKKSGVKAYLKAIYVTLHEDEFESKYIDVPDSALSSMKYGD